MGLWHGVEYYEKEKVVGEEFYQQWSNVSIPRENAHNVHSSYEKPVVKSRIEFGVKSVLLVENNVFSPHDFCIDPAREQRNHVRLEFRAGLAGRVFRLGCLVNVFLWVVLSGRRERQGANEQRSIHNARLVV